MPRPTLPADALIDALNALDNVRTLLRAADRYGAYLATYVNTTYTELSDVANNWSDHETRKDEEPWTAYN